MSTMTIDDRDYHNDGDDDNNDNNTAKYMSFARSPVIYRNVFFLLKIFIYVFAISSLSIIEFAIRFSIQLLVLLTFFSVFVITFSLLGDAMNLLHLQYHNKCSANRLNRYKQ